LRPRHGLKAAARRSAHLAPISADGGRRYPIAWSKLKKMLTDRERPS
jgi:hypothetical protein